MNNQMITQTNYNMQMEMTLEGILEENISQKPRKPLVFQPYTNRQSMMIPDIESFIPEHHVARLVDEMVESIPDKLLFSHYVGGGRAPYHPKLLLKVILYAYTQKIYSSRSMKRMVEENLPAMWLAGMQTPDHRTINDFRGVRMPAIMEELFEQFLLQLVEQELVDLEYMFIDGTKIEANANKYSFVWGKALANHDQKLREKTQSLIRDVRAVTTEELREDNLEEQLTKTVEQLTEEVQSLESQYEQASDKEERKQLRMEKSKRQKHIKTIETDYLPRLARYEAQREILGERNSYSKTDHDATFMRMKDDHMKNGQLKAGYNVQIATQNQFIIGYKLFQRPGDTRCFQPFMNQLMEALPKVPTQVIADAGYASEENYLFAMGEEQEPLFELLAPYNTYVKEQTKSYKQDISKVQNWPYREEEDVFICPNNRKVLFKRYSQRKNTGGYEQDYKIYECEDCTDCPLKALCTKAKGNRQVHWNPVYEEMKAKARAALDDEQKAALYAKRKVDVETVFGDIKGNRSFTRFLLRGLAKTQTEFGLVAIAHNLLKVAGIRLATFSQKEKMRCGKRPVLHIALFI
ncbi:IS1182 family transposase [Lysinibacillus pakistanensis]|uniref:IS1182 family transposase n=1 Tax=Lysinibacillus pakistanensis TaxID=759811 RepID=UPI003D2B070B